MNLASSVRDCGEAITGSALEALDCQVAVLAESGEVVLANRAWRKLTNGRGWSPRSEAGNADFLRDIASPANPSDSSDRIVDGIRAVLSRRIDQFLFDYDCGETRRFHMSVNACEIDGTPYAIISRRSSDSRTDSRVDARAAEATGATRLREPLALLADQIPSLVWSMSATGDLQYGNGRCNRTLMVPPGTRVEEVLTELIHPADRDQRWRAWHGALQDVRPYRVDYRLQSFDGAQPEWHSECGAPVHDESGAHIGWAVVATPLAGPRGVENDLRQALRTRDEFVLTLLHELKGPLAPIGNALELLTRSQGQLETVQIARAIIERQFGQLRRLVDDLLDTSQLSSGFLSLKPRLIDLQDSLRTALEAAEPLIKLRRHQLAVDAPAGAVMLQADPERLVQVLTNLLVNAAKYTPAGGHISVTVESDALECRIRVRDDGVGIAKEKLTEIFLLFSRGDSASVPDSGGLGIGLAVARQLVELHGGRITVHSAGERRGSEFTVHLPVTGSVPPARHTP